MRSIELHTLISLPYSNAVRDDNGAPKTAIFGGVKRARLSSQSVKRAVRMSCREHDSGHYRGIRSKFVIKDLYDALKQTKYTDDQALEIAQAIGMYLSGLDDKDNTRTKTLIFYSPDEIKALVAEIQAVGKVDWVLKSTPKKKKVKQDNEDSEEKSEEKINMPVVKKVVQAALKGKQPSDFVDLALFGRMVASDPSLKVEGVASFAHSLGVHRDNTDIDFFTAVDDHSDPDGQGAAHMDDAQYTSATYYSYVHVNLDELQKKLAGLSEEHRKAAAYAFIRSVVESGIPSGKSHSTAPFVRPCYALGLVTQGVPMNFAGAYECPLNPSSEGYEKRAIERLKSHRETMVTKWDLNILDSYEIEGQNGLGLKEFCEELSNHV